MNLSTTLPNKYDAVLIGGFDDRTKKIEKNGKIVEVLIDKTLPQQVDLLKNGLGENKKIMGFHYNTSDNEINNFLKNNPNILVVLFSKGCEKVNSLQNVDKKKNVIIIEPYAVKEKSINFYLNCGVPL